MLSELSGGQKVVGLKQSQRAVCEKRAKKVYLAVDAEQRIKDTVTKLCADYEAELVIIDSMHELGVSCGIQVGAAVAVLLA